MLSKKEKARKYRMPYCVICKSKRLVFDAKGKYKACLNCFENLQKEEKEINPLDDY